MSQQLHHMFFKRLLLCLMMVYVESFSVSIISGEYGRPGLLYTNDFKEESSNLPMPQLILKIRENDLNKSVNFAEKIIAGMERLETNLDWSNIHIAKGSPSHGQLIDSEPTVEALRQGKAALIAAKATMQLMNVHCTSLATHDCIKQISQLSMAPTPLQLFCPAMHHFCTAKQLNSPYYSADGSCNNKIDGLAGKSFTGYKRILPANYVDGVQEPRTRSVKKKHLLPSPRVISTTLCKHRRTEDNELTLAVMQWSQFVEHDLAHTATSKMMHFDSTIECCESDGTHLSPRYVHPFCQPISIPENDVFYSKYGIECMTYIRSVVAMNSDCKFGAVDQLNQATHFLDGSHIYGPDLNESYSLRMFEKGLLNYRKLGSLQFLMKSKHPSDSCQYNKTSCFVSGDSRVNTVPQLTAMHIIWHREHNRVASQLARINTNWDDETIFQEARRIVIAEIQHITYNEWLPAVLGKKYISKIQQPDVYSAQIDPRVSNSFATAGLRFFNSLFEDILKLYTEDRKVNSSITLKEHFNRPYVVEEANSLDGLIRGLATQHSRKLDLNYADDVTTHLYNNGEYGYDVLSLDIQRGRDHGLPTYNAVRTLCGLTKVKEFSDLANTMLPETIELLKKLYSSPEDIDLLVGGISETHFGDSILGPTLSCIVADQLLRTKRGDRYFYDNEQQPKPFTKAQRAEIEKTTLARIFCDNSNAIEFMQTNVFKQISASNPLYSCIGKEIPYMNLRAWTM